MLHVEVKSPKTNTSRTPTPADTTPPAARSLGDPDHTTPADRTVPAERGLGDQEQAALADGTAPAERGLGGPEQVAPALRGQAGEFAGVGGELVAGQGPGSGGWGARVLGRVPGVGVVLVLAGVAVPLGRVVPVVGGPVFGIVLGVLAGVLVPALRREKLRPGYDFASKNLLQLSIVVLGTGLSLQQVVRVGGSSLPVMLGTLTVALGGAWVFGRLLGVRGDTQTLIGVGTAICGGSAIAAATAAIGAKRSSVAYALATIFTFNVVAVLAFPPLGHLLGLSPEAFGLWAGTAINDTSSVVAAGYAYSQSAGDQALVVKLTRSLTLVPIVLTLVLLKSRREARAAARTAYAASSADAPAARAAHVALPAGAGADARTPSAAFPANVPGAGAAHVALPADGAAVARGGGVASGGGAGAQPRKLPWRKLVPLFLVGFVAAAGLRSAGVVPDGWQPGLTLTGTFLITCALVAIGLSLRPSELRAAGIRPLLLGAILWVAVAVASLLLQLATHNL